MIFSVNFYILMSAYEIVLRINKFAIISIRRGNLFPIENRLKPASVYDCLLDIKLLDMLEDC